MAKKKEELQNPEEQATFTKDQFMGSENIVIDKMLLKSS